MKNKRGIYFQQLHIFILLRREIVNTFVSHYRTEAATPWNSQQSTLTEALSIVNCSKQCHIKHASMFCVILIVNKKILCQIIFVIVRFAYRLVQEIWNIPKPSNRSAIQFFPKIDIDNSNSMATRYVWVSVWMACVIECVCG